MKKAISFVVMLLLMSILAIAQNLSISGKVVDENGIPVGSATILVKGTNNGTSADAGGNFRINASVGDILIISSVNLPTMEVMIKSGEPIIVTMVRKGENLTEVVVTALGIRKTRNQVSYAAQQLAGEEVSKTRTNNFVNTLSGKVSGLEIRQANTLGGSTNVVLRGAKSITGNNQALFVVDGVPYDNSITNTADQRTGRGGYDYGTAAADLNPDDIENITVLKGAAASALYGSRGSNGVILITTKKGKKGLGIQVNMGVSYGVIDKSTFITYQQKYGGGYGKYYEDTSGYFLYRDPVNFEPLDPSVNPNGVLVVPTSEDASYGAPFNPNLNVLQWDAFDPTSPYYKKGKPWVAAANGPASFLEKPWSTNNSILIDGGGDKGTFKLGYTRNDDRGILPNSKITKNLISFGSTYNINEKLTAGASINFSNINGLGRYGTGYDNQNMMSNFRQWWQVNVDIKDLKDAYFRTKKNVTWNPTDPLDLNPIYWNNPYFTRYENYENDTRNRYFGNVNVNYKLNEAWNVLGRISLDSYSEQQDERRAIGSTTNDGPAYFSRLNRNYNEVNYDLMANYDKNVSADFNLKALIGTNIRLQRIQSIFATTNGGLVIPNNYSLQNSASPIEAPDETDQKRQILGIFAGTTLTYKNYLNLDATVRRDASSTLPKGKNTYYYPSVSLGFVFSQLMKSQNWLSYGKIRVNYAEVGNDAPVYSIKDVYNIISPFGSNPLASVNGTRNNPNLLPERTKSSEIGLEIAFLKNRLGFDATYYRAESFNQILPTTVSTSTGYNSKFLNAGTIVNKGIELSAFGTPVKTNKFSWTVNVNWTRNRNKVVSLFEGSDNLVLGTFQGGVSINATLNQPYGTIRGSNFVYDAASGQPIVKASNGRYLISPTSNEVIGNPNPDWIGGISNTVKFKNVSLSWLVDIRKGGDVFSLDMYYGLATGLYPETAGNNDLGNPLRLPIAQGGGIIRAGVNEDGKPNTKRAETYNFGAYGYRYSPAAGFVYDAGFVKLREVVLTYSLPKNIMSKLSAFKGIDFNLIGRNLWIIHKNLPYADPEETVSAGNLQGYQVGAYPTLRTFTFNIKLKF